MYSNSLHTVRNYYTCIYANYHVSCIIPHHTTVFKPFPKRQILDSSKLKEFADDNFRKLRHTRVQR